MAYVGIDLGTTNSAIASYDGRHVHLYKSPEQHDVTPSVIFINRRSRFVGYRAYVNAAASPDNAARLFKRMMGTSSPVRIPALDLTMTPEQASAEVLSTLVGYLPDDIRSNEETGYVITVPAAFNQMQRAATLAAAEMANIGKVALMQEPVAAVMSVMQADSSDGIFLVFDIGGGTLDVAIAESIGGRVSLLAHGGVEMLGGRDFDRLLFDSVVTPWLYENFHLPPNWRGDSQYKRLHSMATWATERAKIELSQRDSAVINLSEEELNLRDIDGVDIYIECEITREQMDRLIAPRVNDAIEQARRTIGEAGLAPDDIERIVFIGGPTHYSPLRDRAAFELGIQASTYVNPMTAVATGAAIFAESIDWSDVARGRKASRGTIRSTATLSFNYTARTPDQKAVVAVITSGMLPEGADIQFDSLESGWTSGRMPLREGETYELPLPSIGSHTFRVSVHGSGGGALQLESDRIEVTRTAASIEAIPASHSIMVEARQKAGGPILPVYLVRAGEELPKQGIATFRAEHAIQAGSDDALRFKLWEGEIADRIHDNMFIGMFDVRGEDLVSGHIPAGAELICHYEILDSGEIRLSVEVPAASGTFSSAGKTNFYSRQQAQVDFSEPSTVQRIFTDRENTEANIDSLERQVSDHRLDKARQKLEAVDALGTTDEDAELAKKSRDSIEEAKRLLSEVRREHRERILQMELGEVIRRFDEQCREYASPSDEASFDNLVRTAQRAIATGSADAEEHLQELHRRIVDVLWRQDWWVQAWFEGMIKYPWMFEDQKAFEALKSEGEQAIAQGNFNQLRSVVYEMNRMRYSTTQDPDAEALTNIIIA